MLNALFAWGLALLFGLFSHLRRTRARAVGVHRPDGRPSDRGADRRRGCAI